MKRILKIVGNTRVLFFIALIIIFLSCFWYAHINNMSETIMGILLAVVGLCSTLLITFGNSIAESDKYEKLLEKVESYEDKISALERSEELSSLEIKELRATIIAYKSDIDRLRENLHRKERESDKDKELIIKYKGQIEIYEKHWRQVNQLIAEKHNNNE